MKEASSRPPTTPRSTARRTTSLTVGNSSTNADEGIFRPEEMPLSQPEQPPHLDRRRHAKKTQRVVCAMTTLILLMGGAACGLILGLGVPEARRQQQHDFVVFADDVVRRLQQVWVSMVPCTTSDTKPQMTRGTRRLNAFLTTVFAF